MAKYPDPISKLIFEFQRMPGIGPKSAQRLAFYIMDISVQDAEKIISAINSIKKEIRRCSICNNITVSDPCSICSDGLRDKSSVCVVSDPKDMMAIEKTKGYTGLYHIIGGVISPLDNVRPEDLKISELLKRLSNGTVSEVILAMNPTVEGEATALYLSKLLNPLGIKITRIAFGLPIGSDMDFADEVTISKSFEGRREID